MIQAKLEFKKVELEPRSRSRRSPKFKAVYVHVNKKGDQKRLHVTPALMEEAGFEIGDRVDLLQCGSMFALRKDNNDGAFKFVKYNMKTGVICSTSLCEYVMKNPKKTTNFDAWVQDGMVMFKPRDNE